MINPHNRQLDILKLIEIDGSVNISELSKNMNVSEMTIRRDLIELEKMNLIRRIHGGAVISFGRSYEAPLISRQTQNIEGKRRIGKYAAEMIRDGDSVALDVGSTTTEVARNIIGWNNLTILTPSLIIAGILVEQNNIRVIVSGGILRPSELSLVGDLAYYAFKDMYVDKLFLGAAGIDSKVGITEFNYEDAQVKKAMIRSAKEVILVIDSAKFEKTVFSFVTGLNSIHHMVTDQAPPPALTAKLKDYGVILHVVAQ